MKLFQFINYRYLMNISIGSRYRIILNFDKYLTKIKQLIQKKNESLSAKLV